MNTNELRIGNYVFENDNKIKQVTGILNDAVFTSSAGVQIVNPIPLTEEWLLKFGFKLFGKNTYYLGTVKIHKRKRGFVIAKRYADILHVHQLQNLYFALTQKELTIN